MNTSPVKTLERLKKRRDFVRISQTGVRQVTTGMVILAAKNPDDTQVIRVGFTASKKVGKAVQRNRAKRRLRALAQDLLPSQGVKGYDYVLIARHKTVTGDFQDLKKDLGYGLRKLKHRIETLNDGSS